MSTAEQIHPPTPLESARRLAARGWRVFPCEYRGKRPAVGIKWSTAAASTPAQGTLELWFGRDPVNVGVAARGSGLVILDEDRLGAMERLCETYGQPVPQTYRVRTAKGWHWYFDAPGGVDIGNAPGLLAEFGFDVRGGKGAHKEAGGYVVAAGSMHASGHVYVAEDDDADTVELPWWITELLLAAPSFTEPGPTAASDGSDPFDTPRSDRRFTHDQAATWVQRYAIEPLRAAQSPPAGTGRNNALNNAAVLVGHFVPAFWDEAWAVERLTELAEEIGLERHEISPTIRSGMRAGMAKPYMLVEHDPFDLASDSVGHETDAEPRESSWEPIDLVEEWDDDVEPEQATLLKRADGPCLLYPGRTHSVYGESESGKSWIALILVAQVLTGDGDGTALYIDHESDKGPIKSRLRALGVTKEQVRRFTYVRPDGPRDAAWLRLLEQRFTVAVIDGVTVAISADGQSSDSTDETAQWLERVPRALEKHTGAAVLTIDHVTKSRDGRGRFAVGSQAKLNAISGAAYTARVHTPFGRGERGELILRITKDRPGGIRPECGPAGEHGTQEAARVVLDATDPARIKVEIRRWSEAGDEATDLPFGAPIESATSWRDIDSELPVDVVDYAGRGKSAINDLARFMRHTADGGVGQSLTDARRELLAIKNPDGESRHNKWAVQRAWGALLDLNRLALADGVNADTGRALWQKRDGE